MEQMGVIFDLDGVLVDTSQFHKRSWFELAGKEGYDMSDEFFYSTFGMQNYQILPLLAGAELPAERLEQMAQWKERRYRELMGSEVMVMEGAEELVAELFVAIVVIVSILVSGGLEKGRPSIIGVNLRILSKIRGVLPGQMA